MVKHLLEGNRKKDKIDHWQTSNQWFEYMSVFWNVAKDFYESNSELWSDSLEEDGKTPSSRLMWVSVIRLYQKSILEYMAEALEMKINDDVDGQLTMETELPDIEKFREYCQLYIKRMKPEFFTDWGEGASGLQGSKSVRDNSVEAIRSVISTNQNGIIQILKTRRNLIFGA